jgi:phage antirepressor YoqD-like protein
MNEIINSGGAVRMSSVEIAHLTGKRHDNVVADIRGMLHQLDLGTPVFSGVYTAENAQQYRCFYLPKDLTLTLVAGYNVQLRKRIIDRWLELESQATAAIPSSFAAALRLAAEQQEKIEQQTQLLAAAKPALEFVDKYVDATGSKGFRQVCKLLHANENEFRLFLQARKIMYRLNGEWVPHSCHMDAGRFEVKAGLSGSTQHAFNQAQFTPKGVTWVAGEWAKYQLEAAVPA